MSYVQGNPVTGFTIELDGDSEAIERVGRKIMRAIQDEFDRAARDQQAMWSGWPERALYILPITPFQGVLHMRTTP